MARPSELEGRLLAVLADRRARVPVRASRWCVATLMAAATGLALGATPARPAPADGPHPLTPAVRHNMFGETPTFEQQVEAYRARTTASEALAASPDPEARERAVLDLAASATDTTIPSLTRALRDESQDVREKAAFALGLLSSPDVIPPLLQALRDPDAQVREKAAIGLALRRDPRSVEALIAAMRDPDSQVREKVALSLGTSGDDRAVPSLSAALSDQDPQVREKATLALGFLNTGTPDASHSEDVRSALRSLVSGLLGLAR